MNEREWPTQEMIDRGNTHARKYNGEFVFWTPDEVVNKLKDAPERLVNNESAWGDYKSTEIEVDGKWYRLGNTDLLDDVRTSGCISVAPVASDTAVVCRAAHYGARATESSIYLINSLSDG